MNAPTKSPSAETIAGTVVEVHGIRATVLLHEEQRRQRCRPMRDRTPLAVGDRVRVDGSRSVPEIVSMETRERCLWRPVERGRRIMASRVDRVIVVGAVLPEMRPGLVDRILVAADAQEATITARSG